MNEQINRAAQLWQNWEQKQQMLKEVFGGDAVAADLSRQKHDFLTQGMHRIIRPNADEKMVLELIGKAAGKLEKHLYPNPLIRLLHKVKELVFDKPLRAAKLENQKMGDVFRLENELGRIGISGTKLDLAAALDYQRQTIALNIAAPYGTSQNFELSLHLEKDTAGRYQLEGYSAALKDPSGNAPDRSYRFAASLELTAKEAANLLEGRAVLKQDGAKESGHWLQLDFKNTDQKGQPALKSIRADQGFDLKKELAVLAGELGRGELAANEVLKALEAGKQVAVKPVLWETTFLEANPSGRGVLLRDSQQQPVSLAQLKENQAQQRQERENSLTPVRHLTFEKQKETDQSLQIS